MSDAYKTSSPLLSLPSAADGISVTPSGVTETFSAWVEMVASAATDMVLATIIGYPGVREVGNFYEIEIGTGAMGAETAVAAARGYSGANVLANADLSDVLPVAIPADVINTGNRVSCRLKQTSTTTTVWRVSVQYWVPPVADTVPVATVGPVNVPAGSRKNLITGAGTTFGSWVEITAATDADWALAGMTYIGPNQSVPEFQIGTGAAASETVRWTATSVVQYFNFGNAYQGGPYIIQFRPTLGPVASGARIAMRVRSINGTGGTYNVGLTVIKQIVSGVTSNLERLNTGYLELISGGGTNFGSWVEAMASASTDIIAVGMARTYLQTLTGNAIVQFGVGSAGAETLFAEVYHSAGVWGGGRFNFPFTTGRLIPQGSRVAMRVASASFSTISHFVAMEYLVVPTDPDYDNWTDDLIQLAYYNAGHNTATVAAGVLAWGNGSWVEIDLLTPVNRVITAYQWFGVDCEVEFDIGIGPLGSEAVVTTIRMGMGSDSSGGSLAHDILPMPAIIPENSRLVARARCSVAGSQAFRLGLHYTAEPTGDTPVPPPPAPTIRTANVRWLFRTPHVSDVGQRIRHKKLQIDMQVGTATSTGEGSDPTVQLRFSDDGAYTWSNTRTELIGPIGAYHTRVQFWQLGAPRDRVYEVWGDSPTPECAIIQGFIELEEFDR